MCECKVPAVLKTVRDTNPNNAGREYYSCGTVYGTRCNFFQWKDEAVRPEKRMRPADTPTVTVFTPAPAPVPFERPMPRLTPLSTPTSVVTEVVALTEQIARLEHAIAKLTQVVTERSIL